jgi:hypothetical protein
MFEGASSDTCTGKFLLILMGDRAEGLVCADTGARTPIDVSGILLYSTDNKLDFLYLSHNFEINYFHIYVQS